MTEPLWFVKESTLTYTHTFIRCIQKVSKQKQLIKTELNNEWNINFLWKYSHWYLKYVVTWLLSLTRIPFYLLMYLRPQIKLPKCNKANSLLWIQIGVVILLVIQHGHSNGNLQSSLLWWGTRPNEWGAQWDSNSLV